MPQAYPDANQFQPYRRHTLWLYLLIALLLLLSAGYAVFQLWGSYRDDTLVAMRRNAYRTSQLVDAAVQDATKVLDMARSGIETAMRAGPVTPRAAHDILHHTSERLSVPGSVLSQGLLFVTDAKGTLYARNSQYPVPVLHVQDRLYFRTLKAHPELRFSIGNLTLGRASHTVVFHVAEPLHDASGRFAGVVLQQIPGDQLQQQLRASLGPIHSTLDVLLDADHCAFTYPLPHDPSELKPAQFEGLFMTAEHDGHDGSWLQFHDGLDRRAEYLAYAHSPTTGLLTVERVSRQRMLIDFIGKHLQFLLLSTLATWLILLLLALHYRQTQRLLVARDASLRDELTGLPNRRALDERFPLLWREALRLRANTSALFVDIDHFKRFNDSHGHVCADHALREVAQTIQSCLRRPFDFACRWGGEEFVVLLPQTDAHGAMLVAEAILQRVRAIRVQTGDCHAAGVSVSIGVASLRVTPEHFENDLIDLADKAMLRAKHNGRDQIYLI